VGLRYYESYYTRMHNFKGPDYNQLQTSTSNILIPQNGLCLFPITEAALSNHLGIDVIAKRLATTDRGWGCYLMIVSTRTI